MVILVSTIPILNSSHPKAKQPVAVIMSYSYQYSQQLKFVPDIEATGHFVIKLVLTHTNFY